MFPHASDVRTAPEMATCRVGHKPFACTEDSSHLAAFWRQAKVSGNTEKFNIMKSNDPTGFADAVIEFKEKSMPYCTRAWRNIGSAATT